MPCCNIEVTPATMRARAARLKETAYALEQEAAKIERESKKVTWSQFKNQLQNAVNNIYPESNPVNVNSFRFHDVEAICQNVRSKNC